MVWLSDFDSRRVRDQVDSTLDCVGPSLASYKWFRCTSVPNSKSFPFAALEPYRHTVLAPHSPPLHAASLFLSCLVTSPCVPSPSQGQQAFPLLLVGIALLLVSCMSLGLTQKGCSGWDTPPFSPKCGPRLAPGGELPPEQASAVLLLPQASRPCLWGSRPALKAACCRSWLRLRGGLTSVWLALLGARAPPSEMAHLQLFRSRPSCLQV